MKKDLVARLVVVALVSLVAFSCLSMQVPRVNADTYNQIPLWINIIEGAIMTQEEIDDIEKEIDKIFKDNGLNWRVTSEPLMREYGDPDKTRDKKGDIRVHRDPVEQTEEEEGIWKEGHDETRDIGGFKVFVAREILDENGRSTTVTGVAIEATRTAIVEENTSANTWAHEIGHLFGLGHEKQNGTARPINDLMYPFEPRGSNLQGEDINKMNQTKIEEDLGLPTLTDEQRKGNRTYEMYRTVGEDEYEDSAYNFTDLQDVYFAFYMLDETRVLHITTYLGGVIPMEETGFGYFVLLDIDNDTTTGGVWDIWEGIDFIVHVNTSSSIVSGMLYSYPDAVPITPLEARVETHFKFICTENPPVIPPGPVQDSIVISLPLQFVDPLSETIRISTLIESDDGVGLDWLDTVSVSTVPPERPSLTFDQPIAPSGTFVTATGSGFTPNNSVSIIFAHINLSTAKVGSDGSFQTTFTVPELPPDHYMVDAIDESHKVGVNMFTIPWLDTDLNKDGTVNILDISIVAMAFGSRPGDEQWNEMADLNNDEIINILDISTIAMDFGKTV